MDAKERKLQEQSAPEKNTDHAFVQVGSDGHPVIPHTTGDEKEEKPRKEAQENNER